MEIGTKLNFWRTNPQKEIDFILEKGFELTPLKVKSGKVKLTNIKSFFSYYPNSKSGFILFDGKFQKKENLTFIPFWIF